MSDLIPTLHAITIDARHAGYVDLDMMREQIDLLARLAARARDDEHDDIVAIMQTFEALLTVADPVGGDPSYDLSRCARCGGASLSFEGASVDEYGATRRFYCQDCGAEGHIQFSYKLDFSSLNRTRQQE